MLVPAARRIEALLRGGASPAQRGVTAYRLLRLVEEVLGDDLYRYPDGRMLIWDIARHDGYRNRALWRKVFLVPSTELAGDDADRAARAVLPWLAFALGTATGSDDPSLFQR